MLKTKVWQTYACMAMLSHVHDSSTAAVLHAAGLLLLLRPLVAWVMRPHAHQVGAPAGDDIDDENKTCGYGFPQCTRLINRLMMLKEHLTYLP